MTDFHIVRFGGALFTDRTRPPGVLQASNSLMISRARAWAHLLAQPVGLQCLLLVTYTGKGIVSRRRFPYSPIRMRILAFHLTAEDREIDIVVRKC